VGQVIQYSDNNQGVWVVGNAKSVSNTNGSFSATVKLLTDITDIAGACVYASNYPPVAKYTAADRISFTGTPMYGLVLMNAENDSIYKKSGADFDIPAGSVLVSFTDATGAPGITHSLTPPHAASTKTWVMTACGITQTWSDYINMPSCKKSIFEYDVINPLCSSWPNNDVLFYYYNAPYVIEYTKLLCPEPWRLPTTTDVRCLDVALGGTGINRVTSRKWIDTTYVAQWNLLFSGTLDPALASNPPWLHMWLYTESDAVQHHYFAIRDNGNLRFNDSYGVLGRGYVLRCVK
jgi:hypothetical protein